ncbi:hypothetical protein F5884DRAFT_799728 [Xylogone sp. PMI_703]|nr:hypothetical protein F5884DRAFT_799728 [Xylogone sp. PMI_703]
MIPLISLWRMRCFTFLLLHHMMQFRTFTHGAQQGWLGGGNNGRVSVESLVEGENTVLIQLFDTRGQLQQGPGTDTTTTHPTTVAATR